MCVKFVPSKVLFIYAAHCYFHRATTIVLNVTGVALFSSTSLSFSEVRFDINHLELCRLLVYCLSDAVEILMKIFRKNFYYWMTEKTGILS